ncbi:hypothetical protein GGR57DRAFT_501578 [Xylariaceae sp. FL1272]|nr:hypothetical protein GGR57DRAFT_501578 [Xylariaceae sp. FL1272]
MLFELVNGDEARGSARKVPRLDSALFNFQSLLLVILLFICTSTYIHSSYPSILDRNKQGFLGLFWKAARIGERLSPYMALCCIFMAASLIIA